MSKPVKCRTNDLQGLRIVTVHQFASDFLTSYQTALKWLKDHNIPIHKVGSKAWVCHEDLIKYFKSKAFMPNFSSASLMSASEVVEEFLSKMAASDPKFAPGVGIPRDKV